MVKCFWIFDTIVSAGCSDYKDIKYGEVDFTDGNTTFGSVLLITCYSGYKLQGGYGVECMPDGCWETNATCIAGME